jgi:hypothetical protein
VRGADRDDSPLAGREVRRGDLVRIDMPNGKVDLGLVVELDGTQVRLLDAR